jgi:1,4-dihydroxy-2-naphthoate octaprenyltransferase
MTSPSSQPVASGAQLVASPHRWHGLARLADPKVSLASFASLFLGSAAAAVAGPLHGGWLLLTVLGIFAIEVAKNAMGEVVDWDSGVDQAVAPDERSPFSGGKRVLVDGLLSRRETQGIGAIAYAVGIACGLAIAFGRAPVVLWIGLVGVALAHAYHGWPLRLAYHGLGELAVMVTYGPLIAAGAYAVQVGHLDRAVVLAALPLGLLIGAFLWINEFPDHRADAAGGKRNLVVRLGRQRASRVFAAILAVAFGLLVLLPFLGLPPGVLLGLVAAIPAFAAARRLMDSPESVARIIPAQAWTLFAFLLYALGAGTGWYLTGS